MGCWEEQALFDAPLPVIWDLVGDPREYPSWVPEEVVEVTGLPTVEKGARFEHTGRGPLGQKSQTTFEIDELEALHQIRLRCTVSGWYSRWILTEADGATFAHIEVGMEPTHVGYKAVDVMAGKRWYRRVARAAVEGLKRSVADDRTASPS